MAGLRFKFTKTVTVAGNTTITLGQLLAATNVRAAIDRLAISVKGAAQADKALLFQLMRQTGGTGSGGTLTKLDSDAAETLQTTAKDTFTVEPTYGSVIWSEYVGAWGGKAVFIPDGPDGLLINGGDINGLVVTTDSGAGSAVIVFDIDCKE